MLSKEQLKQIVMEQRSAILAKDPGVEREALKTLGKKMRLPHVIVLSGLRRCGKSTLMRQAMRAHCADRDFYYLTFEDERLLDFDAARFNDIYEALVELFGEKRTFFIDEIQNVDRFEAFVRRFSDAGFKFIISGSNAKVLSRELGTKLTGRHVDIVVRPFSFREFLLLRRFSFEQGMLYRAEGRAAIKRLFGEHLVEGGMPEYLLHGDPELLTRTYEDIVIKDIAVRHRIGDVSQLRNLYRYLITNMANRFSFNSLKKALQFGSVNTVKAYISHIEEAYLVKVICRFEHSLKRQMAADKKLYVADNAFVPLLSTKTTRDRGRMLENLVFNSLAGAYDVFTYRRTKECDFVAVKGNAVRSAIQVCWELTETNRERELGGLAECMADLRVKEGLVLTYDQEEEITLAGKNIRVKPVWKWLLE